MVTVETPLTPVGDKIPDVLVLPCAHCHGSGRESAISVLPHWRPILEALRDAGERRSRYGNARTESRARERFYDVIDEIRKLLEVARREGIPSRAVEHYVGVSRVHLHNIRTGRTGRPLPNAGQDHHTLPER